jgi:Domain of unknown function (DUF4388)
MGVAPLEGSLTGRDFPALVRAVYEDAWTGTIVLAHMDVTRSVVAQGGRLIFATSTCRDDRLGDVLLRQGRITLHQYVEAGREVRAGKRLGTLLVEKGAILPKDLVNGVVEQTREIIYAMFQWTEGTYRFIPGEIPAEAITLNISTPDLVLEGVRRIESWTRIERAVGGLDARYGVTPRGAEIASKLSLSADKAAIVTGLTGTQNVDEICTRSSLSHFEICRTLWAFQAIGIIQRVEQPAPLYSVEDDGLESVLSQELPDVGS